MMRCRVNLFGGVQLDPVAQLVEQRTLNRSAGRTRYPTPETWKAGKPEESG
jgi:hypothetical protein